MKRKSIWPNWDTAVLMALGLLMLNTAMSAVALYGILSAVREIAGC